MIELPVLTPTCPAATPLAGPIGSGPSVVCGVMQREQGRIDSILDGIEKGVLNTLREDPSIVRNMCCGDALPVTGEGDPEVEIRHAHFTNCEVWQAARDSELAHKAFSLAQERPQESAVPGVGPEDPTQRELDAMFDEEMSEHERERVRQHG